MPDWIIPLLALTAMEVVLGIDNIIFIAILVGKLPKSMQPQARLIGLSVALMLRVVLILGIQWLMTLNTPLFHWTDLGVPVHWFEVQMETEFPLDELTPKQKQLIEAKQIKLKNDRNDVSGKDLILLLGGLFLIAKTTYEMHEKLEAGSSAGSQVKASSRFSIVVAQIVAIDLIFSIDSVITAVAMVPWVWIMICAMSIAMGFMLLFSGMISDFINRHPTMKMLALSFLILIGVLLVIDGLGTHINRSYVYFAMGFAFMVELLNMRMRRTTHPVVLLNQISEPVSAS